jgi:acetyl-CoA decarbonylase/synthase complex subunit gamma
MLPKTNCGECGFPTCLAFAMRLAAGQAELDACPSVSEEAKAKLSEASAPPIRLVSVGTGDMTFKVGEEQVLFRHEKTFYNPCGFALLVEDTMSDKEIDEKIGEIKGAQFERIAQILRADLVALKNSSGDASKFAALVKKVSGSLDFPLILVSEKEDALKAALAGCADKKPLLYAAKKNNYESVAALAKENNCPLVVSDESVEGLIELTDKVSGLGVKDLVLDPASRKPGATVRDFVYIRRSALRQKLRSLGYPVIAFPSEETSDSLEEALLAAVYVTKYGGIIVLRSLEPWKALPLFVLRQNIYTDPQQPMQVEEKVYALNSPGETSPVLVTTNFSLTYFIVSGEVEASKVPAWLCVMDVEGLSVLTAWAAGKFVPEKIAPFIKKSGIQDKVKHRTLIIPGYISQISGELEDEMGDNWKVQVGTREAGDIPAFLKQWKA